MSVIYLSGVLKMDEFEYKKRVFSRIVALENKFEVLASEITEAWADLKLLSFLYYKDNLKGKK